MPIAIEILRRTAQDDGDGPVEQIAFEALRLYRQTRHVIRRTTVGQDSSYDATADIADLRRTPPAWVPDLPLLRHQRSVHLKEDMNANSFLTFGDHPFDCPAKMHRICKLPTPCWVSMIPTLTGALVHAMGADWELELGEDPLRRCPLRMTGKITGRSY